MKPVEHETGVEEDVRAVPGDDGCRPASVRGRQGRGASPITHLLRPRHDAPRAHLQAGSTMIRLQSE